MKNFFSKYKMWIIAAVVVVIIIIVIYLNWDSTSTKMKAAGGKSASSGGGSKSGSGYGTSTKPASSGTPPKNTTSAPPTQTTTSNAPRANGSNWTDSSIVSKTIYAAKNGTIVFSAPVLTESNEEGDFGEGEKMGTATGKVFMYANNTVIEYTPESSFAWGKRYVLRREVTLF